MNKIKVIIVDDQKLMIDGLKTIIDLEEDIKVIDTCNNGKEAIEKTSLLKPDVILMDIRMPIKNGVEATKEIKEKYPNTKIIILTTFDDDEYILDALSYGADSYLLKDIDADILLKCIRDAHKGMLLMPSNIAMKLAKYINEKKSKKHVELFDELSKREIDIAKMMIKGLNNKEISSDLFLTEGTVKNYISSIYSKLGVKDRASAVIILKDLLD